MRILMPTKYPHWQVLLIWTCLLSAVLVSQGCKSKKPIADSYKYLIKPDPKPVDSVAVTIAPPKNVTATGKVKVALDEADTYLGTPYRHGGINQNGIDCSGLAHKSYLAAGINLPRSTVDQAIIGKEVQRKDLLPGDLVFFTAKSNGQIDHVGIIYKIEGSAVVFIHASSSKGVRYDRLDEGYWKDLFVTARRVAQL
jgi:cell wall-associated NlpC family hydrolase